MALLATAGMPASTVWNIDADHSNVGFKVKHMMISNVNGNFAKFTGTIEADLTKSKVNVSIDVAKFPTMTFVSKTVKVFAKDKLQVTGDLTLHGVTKSVILDVDGPTAAASQLPRRSTAKITA